jgi:hypothetical protein
MAHAWGLTTAAVALQLAGLVVGGLGVDMLRDRLKGTATKTWARLRGWPGRAGRYATDRVRRLLGRPIRMSGSTGAGHRWRGAAGGTNLVPPTIDRATITDRQWLEQLTDGLDAAYRHIDLLQDQLALERKAVAAQIGTAVAGLSDELERAERRAYGWVIWGLILTAAGTIVGCVPTWMSR